MKFKSLLVLAALGASSVAFAQGGYYGQGTGSQGQPTWPIPNTANGTLPLSGNESWIVDTLRTQGQQPQSEYISLATVGNYENTQITGTTRNVLIGGDFTTNLFQRGTSVTGITNTVTYGPDRWFAIGGASSAISLLQETTSLPTNNLFGASARFSEVSTTDTAVVNFGQVISTANSYKFLGRTAVLSFWAKSGSAAPSTFKAIINAGTGSDGSAANMVSAGWTGEVSNSCTITPAAASAWTRFTCSYPISNAMKQVGVQFSFTPTGISSTNQYIEFAGIQLEALNVPALWQASGNYLAGQTVVSGSNLYREVATTCTAGITAPSGTTTFLDNTCSWTYVQGNAVPVVASGFDFRFAEIEKNLQLAYYWQWNETVSATTDSPFLCSAQSSTVAVCKARAAVTFRAAPTIACTFGTIKRMVAGTDTALTACAAAATTNGVSDINEVTITATVASGDTAGFSGSLMSGNSTGGGKITASAEY